jgi:hypothetical protein
LNIWKKQSFSSLQGVTLPGDAKDIMKLLDGLLSADTVVSGRSDE